MSGEMIVGQGGKQGSSRTTVFVSYSRTDQSFALRCAEALDHSDIEASIDTEDIGLAEDWKKRLQNLIAASDAVVVLLSPDWAQSPECRWELDFALRLEKRLLPVLVRPLEIGELPKELKQLNFVDATTARGFDAAISSVVEAAEVNIEWTREHTRLTQLAERWNNSNRRAYLLMRGKAIDAAEAWRDAKPANAPALSSVLGEWIARSRVGATRRLQLAAVIFAVVASFSTVLTVYAINQQGIAETERERAIAKEIEARKSLSETMMSLADNEFFSQSRPVNAAVLALSALSQTESDDEARRADIASELSRFTKFLKERRRLRFDDAVWSGALNRDGSVIALAIENTVHLVDLVSRDAAAVFEGHDDQINQLQITSNDETLITSSLDGSVRVWETASTTELHAFRDHGDAINHIYGLDVGGGDKLLAYGNNQGSKESEIVVRSLTDFEQEPLLRLQVPSFVYDVALSNDSSMVAAAFANGLVQLWSVEDGSVWLSIDAHGGSATSITFAPDDKSIASGGHLSNKTGGVVRIWDTKNGRQLSELNGHERPIGHLEFSPDGRVLASAGGDFKTLLWDVPASRLAWTLYGHDKIVTSAHFLPDGQVVTTSADDTVRFWDTDQIIAHRSVELEHPIWGLEFSQDEKELLVGLGNVSTNTGEAQLISVLNGETIQRFAHNAAVFAGDISPDETLVATASTNGIVKLWDKESGQTLGVWGSGFGPVPYTVQFTPNGEMFAVGTDDGTLVFFNVNALESAFIIELDDWITQVTFSSDGSSVLVGTNKGRVFLIDVATGDKTFYEGPPSMTRALSFQNDETEILALFLDGTAQLWARDDASKTSTTESERFNYSIADISLDGSRFLAGGFPSEAEVVDAHTGQALVVLSETGTGPQVGRFSGSGELIATGSSDGVLRIWRPNLPSGDLWDVACSYSSSWAHPDEENASVNANLSTACETKVNLPPAISLRGSD